jgi:hypothetical protein
LDLALEMKRRLFVTPMAGAEAPFLRGEGRIVT